MWEPEQRESDRYPKATLRQQAEDFVGWFPAHRNGTAAIAIVAGLLLLWRVITPGIVLLGDLREGDCIFVRTGTATAPIDPVVGTPAAVRAAILSGGAERAACDLSHSHEVSSVVDLDDHDGVDPAAAAPPAWDPAGLTASAEEACAGGLAAFLGVPAVTPGTPYVGFAVIPGEREWERGTRVAACLVASADGHFLTARAGGSAR